MQFEESGHGNEKLFLKKRRNIQTQRRYYQGFTASAVTLEIFLRQIGNKHM